MPYIPGSPIDAYCGNCKADTNHVVLEVDGIQVREVRCEKCATRGEFRAPHSKARAKLKATLKQKSTPSRRGITRKRAERPEQVFEKLVEGRDLEDAAPYNTKATLQVGDMVDHPKFGVGVVSALPTPQKARIFFEDGERTMVCNKG